MRKERLKKLKREHDARTASIEKARAALDKRSRAEEDPLGEAEGEVGNRHTPVA